MILVSVLLCNLVLVLAIVYCLRFYPNQQLKPSIIQQVPVSTPETEKYHDDCLHPCIRYCEKGFAGFHYWMVQSPYYGWNNRIENPILYRGNSLAAIGNNGVVIVDTPEGGGYNSDPHLFFDDSVLYVFWRECESPFCKKLGCSAVTIGVSTSDGIHFSERKVYLINRMPMGDIEQAPVLMKRGNEYWFYSTWYEYEPKRRNLGITIWKGTSLEDPDFYLAERVPFDNVFTCDKKAEIRLCGQRFYLPWPKKYDLWHYDLFDKEGIIWLISSAEKDDNIMLSYSADGVHFKTLKNPLVNNHYMQNHVGYRQYYYKPTACIDLDGIHYFWTSNDKSDANKNVLWHACAK